MNFQKYNELKYSHIGAFYSFELNSVGHIELDIGARLNTHYTLVHLNEFYVPMQIIVRKQLLFLTMTTLFPSIISLLVLLFL